MPCELCGGSGKKVVIKTHVLTGKPKAELEWCDCMRSKFVSDSVPYLRGLGDDYLPSSQIDPRLDLANKSNILISGDVGMFRYQIKTVLMKARFLDPPLVTWAGRSIEVLQEFYVEQNDGTCKTLSETQNYGLFIMALGANQKNDRLKTIVPEVIQFRMDQRLPTWVYLPKALELCVYETSDVLAGLFKEFKKITLEGSKDTATQTEESRQKAQGFAIQRKSVEKKPKNTNQDVAG